MDLQHRSFVRHNFFLFRELLSFWVGLSLSLYWEGHIIKSIDIIDHTCVACFFSIKSYLPPTQNMKCLCLCIVFAKYKMSDEAVWFLDLSSSHSLQSSPTSLFAWEFQLFASPTEWFVFCHKIFEESNKGFKQFSNLHSLQIGAGAINIIMLPSILIPVTWFPEHKGLVGTNMKILFLGQINSRPKKNNPNYNLF